MTTRKAALAVAAAIAVAVSVGGSAASANAPHATKAATAAKPTYTVNEISYVSTIRALIADVPHETQDAATLIQGGRDVCASVAGGATWETFDKQIEEFGLDRTLHRSIVSAAVMSFCPERAAQL